MKVCAAPLFSTVFAILAVPPTAFPQQSIDFERISLEQGLSQSSVYAIVQDHQGFMWFGTQDGLNKYDGYSFTVYRRNPDDSTSISGNTVARLLVDSEGSIWAGTTGGGLSRFDPGTGRFEQFLENPHDTNTLSNNRVWAICEDRSGLIWVGTQSGLNSYDMKTRTWRRYFALPGEKSDFSNSVWGVVEDSTGILWVDSGRRMHTFDPATGRFTLVQNGADANTFLLDTRGNFWSYGNEARVYDPGKGKFEPRRFRLTTGETIRAAGEAFLQSARTSEYWIGTYSGLIRVNASSGLATRYTSNPNDPQSLSENSVLSLFEDRSGILWVGTFQGINKYVPTKKKFEVYTHNPKDPNSLSSLRVRGFAEDPTGAIWIATQEGLNRFVPRTKRFILDLPRSGNTNQVRTGFFWCVVVDRAYPPLTVWAGANGPGVAKLVFPDEKSPAGISFVSSQLSNTSVTSVFQDHTGDLWFGQLEGATWYRGSDSSFVRVESLPNAPRDLASATVTFIRQDRNASMWFGSYGKGLIRFDRERGTFSQFLHHENDGNSLSDNNTISFHEDDEGIIWIGTYRGLNRFDPEKDEFQHYTTADGLPNDVIYGILEDDGGNLWLSSNRGLSRFSKNSENILNYDIGDGLQSNEFNQGAQLRAHDGTMYFGGINGFNVFHPDSITLNPHVPQIAITNFKIFNRTVTAGPVETRIRRSINTANQLFLSYYDAVLTFEFAALEFTSPTRNRYAYYMDGFESDWNYVGDKREATYTNLDPGEYTFRVKASNNDGMWNQEGTSLIINIAPPWWMTWWFRGGLILVFLSVGPIIYFRRVSILKKEYALQQEFSRKLMESQENERKRIASELHDSLGQDLLVIKNRTYLANQVKRLNPKAKKELDHISETVTQALRNVRQISRNLRPYHLDRFGLTGAIRVTLESIAESSSIHFDFVIEHVDGLFPPEAKDLEVYVFRIVQECVNNILKHSDASRAKVAVQRSDHQLRIVVEDNGKGFDLSSVGDSSSKAGLGLTGLAERVKTLGGSHNVQSAPGSGTTVTVTIPIRNSPGK